MKRISVIVMMLLVMSLVFVGCLTSIESNMSIVSSHVNQNSRNTFYIDASGGDDEFEGTIDQPYKTLGKVNSLELKPGDRILFKRGENFRGQLFPKSGSEDSVIYYGAYGEGAQPVLMSSYEANSMEDWKSVEMNIYELQESFGYDMGNVVFNNGESFGVKKWSYDELAVDGDYYYDRDQDKTFLYMEDHPTHTYEDIECCVTVDIIDQTGVSYVMYDGLELKYGGAHGIGGGNTSHITIRNMTISYIGGGYLHTMSGVPVRYGNGIEFWANASNHLVENNHIFQILDSGLTNQNNGKKAVHENIVYRNNRIDKCGMASIEIDNKPGSGLVKNILFEDNICSNAGLGWGTTQDRYSNPDENGGLGHHVIVFYMETPVENLIIRDNVFEHAAHGSGLSSMYLLMEIDPESREGFIFEKNNFIGDYDHFGIVVNNGEVRFIEGYDVVFE